MSPVIEFIWFTLFFVIVTFTCYVALQKIDFSKIFKANSTWQINCLLLFLSITIGYLCSDAVIKFIKLAINVIVN